MRKVGMVKKQIINFQPKQAQMARLPRIHCHGPVAAPQPARP
jgi:hypothetical protein